MKRLLERLAVGMGLASARRQARRGRTLILAYHNIVPDGAPQGGDRSLHLPQREFARQLDTLGEYCSVVPLGQALDGSESGELKPRVVVTFDDAYAGAVTAGVEELTRRQLPATIFVVPEFVGGRTFWWDELADDDTGEVPPTIRVQALEALSGRYDQVMDWAHRNGLRCRAGIAADRTATEGDLALAASRPGITLGAHTSTHPNLVGLAAGELDRELTTPRQWLESRFTAATVPWLAYPYGRESGEVREAARRAGYRAALRVDGGWLRDPPETLWGLPRLNVPSGLSLDGFILRLSGIGS